MALLPIPDDFGQGGANIGDGDVRLVDILKNHHDEIAAVEAGSVDAVARAAAATAQTTANGAVSVNTSQDAAIALRPLTTDLASTAHGKGASTIGVEAGSTNVEAKLASLTTGVNNASATAATAQATANTAETDAQTGITAAAAAQTTANGAVSVNTTQNSRLDALEAGGGAIFADEQFRARAKTLAGLTAGSRFYFSDDLELDGWKFYQGVSAGNENPSVVRLEDNTSTTPNNVYPGSTSSLGTRNGKWFISAIARFFGVVGVGSGEWRALVGTNHQDTFSTHFGVGLFENISSTHFSFFTSGDGGDKSAVSTVAYSAGTHKLELWYDGTHFFFAVDEETPIQLSVVTTDFPDGGMSVLFTNRAATQGTWVDAIGYAQTRINAGP